MNIQRINTNTLNHAICIDKIAIFHNETPLCDLNPWTISELNGFTKKLVHALYTKVSRNFRDFKESRANVNNIGVYIKIHFVHKHA